MPIENMYFNFFVLPEGGIGVEYRKGEGDREVVNFFDERIDRALSEARSYTGTLLIEHFEGKTEFPKPCPDDCDHKSNPV